VCSEKSAYAGPAIYGCPGYRLPTEAEWEYAYRAGTTTAYYDGPSDAAVWRLCSPLDANLDKIGWYCGNAGDTTHPVAQKQPNAWGLYDMAGNVWEWVEDWWQDDLGSAAATDPVGVNPGSTRVVRGGSWYSIPVYARAAMRNVYAPSLPIDDIGGRCVRTK
jgi:formylglycine-generating enzyme required for sulfatase activity